MDTQTIKKTAALIIISILLSIACDGDKKLRESGLGYLALLNKEVKRTTSEGRAIPVTIGQSLEIDCDLWTKEKTVSSSGAYLVYSSNENEGNYDIYLRDLNDIIKGRLTEHPAKDFSPAISPDGKRVAYVSLREDPEGDIYVANIDIDDIIEEAADIKPEIKPIDAKARNLTQFINEETSTIEIIKDSYPAWSPDGNHIAFTSTRDGRENIWIMERDGSNMQQLTTQGGLYPRYSPDGREIVFISYRDDRYGNIYTINIETRIIKKLTDSGSIKLYPAYAGNTHTIIYSAIDKDTNNNNKIDINDNSVLYKLDVTSGQQVRLTFYDRSSFNGKWYPVIPNPYYNGIILYSSQQGNNININLIGENGIVAKKNNARNQFRRAVQFKEEFDNQDKYLMGLERIYLFFGNKRDAQSQIYTAKGLALAAYEYHKLGKKQDSNRVLALLKTISQKNKFAGIMYEYTKAKLQNKNSLAVLSVNYISLKKTRQYSRFIPYLLEIIGDEQQKTNRQSAVSTYQKIITDHPKYERINNIKEKNIYLTYTSVYSPVTKDIESFLYKMDVNLTKHIIKLADKEKNTSKLLITLEKRIQQFKGNNRIEPLFHYLSARTLFKQKKYQQAADKAGTALRFFTVKLKGQNSYRSNYITYLSNVLLGDIHIKKSAEQTAPYYYNAALFYRNTYKDDLYKTIIDWLIPYYQNSGEEAFARKNFKLAETLYEHLIETVSTLHKRRQYPELYNKYSSKAHILYIDSILTTKKETNLKRLINDYSEKNLLIRKKIEFDKAHFYALAYLYANAAMLAEKKNTSSFRNEPIGSNGMAFYLKQALVQLDWALFIDDTYIDAYLLQSWIYQLIDVKRNQNPVLKSIFDNYFPPYLLEANKKILEKALAINDESVALENEGNLHLNLGNNYFILANYSRALNHYTKALQMKKKYNSPIEEAVFYFHLGYCYWQMDKADRARQEMERSLYIYNTLEKTKPGAQFSYQTYVLFKYFALFNRIKQDYPTAIKWYKKIIQYTGNYNISIDTARYYQEIAYCYKMSGKLDTALLYLKKTRKQLKKYPDVPPSYDFKAGIFSYDLGEDVIIGNNKIFTELDTLNKKILNISLQEEIYSDRRTYSKVIKYLKQKNALHRERNYDSNKRAIIIGLNNIGYYYYKLGNYQKALAYFKKSWETAKEEEKLEEVFTAIMNTANLYAFTIENNIRLFDDPQAKIIQLNKDIDRFKTNYEKVRFKQEAEELEEQAEIEDREVTTAEKNELRQRIHEDAQEKYYKINIAIGVLQFYQAELLHQAGLPVQPGGENSAPLFYEYNKEIYRLYNSSINRFNTALVTAEKKQSKKLIIKLMLNIATGNTRIGQYREAYRQYLAAAETADKNKFYILQFICNNKLAHFTFKHGSAARIANSLAISDNYYTKVLTQVETLPLLYTEYRNQIKKIYDQYTALLIKQHKAEKALQVTEKKAIINKLFLVNLYSPELKYKEDQAFLNQYNQLVSSVETIKSNISNEYEKISDIDLNKIQGLEKELNNNMRSVEHLIKQMQAEGSRLSTLFFFDKTSYNYPPKTAVFKFGYYNNNPAIWIIDNNKIFLKSMNDSDTSDIKHYIAQTLTDHKDKQLYVILNNYTFDLFKTGFATNTLPPFMFLTSLDQLQSGHKQNNINAGYGLYFGEEMPAAINELPLRLDAGDTQNTSVTGYTVIADNKTNKINTQFLFSNSSINSQLLVKNLGSVDYDSLILLTEAARYSDIDTLVLTINAGNAGLIDLLGNLNTAPFNKNQCGVESGFILFTIGQNGQIRPADIQESGFQKNEYSKYIKFKEAQQYRLAMHHLTKWHLIDKTGTLDQYNFEKAHLLLLEDRPTESLNIIEDAINTISREDPLYMKLISMRIYLQIYNGNIDTAKQLLTENTQLLADYSDITIYNAIYDLHTHNTDSAVLLYNSFNEKKSLLQANRLRFLFLENLHLYGNPGITRTLINQWKDNYQMSQRERLKYIILSEPAASGQTLEAVTQLFRNSGIQNRPVASILADIRGQEVSDTQYIYYKAYFTVSSLIAENKVDEFKQYLNAINTAGLSEDNYWLDLALLYDFLVSTCLQQNLPDGSLLFSNKLTQSSKKRNIPLLEQRTLYHNSLVYFKLNNYEQSYMAALKGEQLAQQESQYYNRFQIMLMHLETLSNDAGRARERIIKINKKNLNPYEHYNYLLVNIRLDLIRLSRKKTTTREDINKFESQFDNVLYRLQKDPDLVLNYESSLITRELFDEYINYKMKTGQFTDALHYTEMKMRIINNLKFLPVRFSRAKIFDINMIPAQVPENTTLIYFAKIRQDLFVWLFRKKMKKAVIIPGVRQELDRLLNEYTDKLSRLEDIRDTARKITALMRPLEQYYKTTKNIIIVTDNYMEKVPFEVLGTQAYLEEQHNMIYLSRLDAIKNVSRAYQSNIHKKNIQLLGNGTENMYNYLEKTALAEIVGNKRPPQKPGTGIGIQHVLSPVIYNSHNKLFFIDNTPFQKQLKKDNLVYLPSFEFANIGYRDLLFYMNRNNTIGVIINDATIHDTNNAFFTQYFYMQLLQNKDMVTSFIKAKQKMRKSNSQKHPAYWARIRLFLN